MKRSQRCRRRQFFLFRTQILDKSGPTQSPLNPQQTTWFTLYRCSPTWFTLIPLRSDMVSLQTTVVRHGLPSDNLRPPHSNAVNPHRIAAVRYGSPLDAAVQHVSTSYHRGRYGLHSDRWVRYGSTSDQRCPTWFTFKPTRYETV